VPRQKDAMIFPACRLLTELSIAPLSHRSISPSENISVCTPRCFLSLRYLSTALGIAPMPAWIVDPLGIRRDT